MHVFRPVRESDFPKLVRLAGTIEGGLTSLPKDEPFLRDRIDDSLRAFDPKVRKPGGENYLFVLEDAAGDVVGTSGIAARVGGYEPFYSYEIRREKFVHKPRNIEREIAALHLKETHSGPTEICSLYLRPDLRRGHLGRLTSLARFLFIRAFPERFDTTIIAELRGTVDAQGKAPFWEAVGRHFFESDFYTADFLSGLGNKEFIADLMPEYPIYVPLLPPEVQAVIGKVRHDSLPALALLQREGFKATNEVDIFDAGPLVRANVGDIRTIRKARTVVVGELSEGRPAEDMPHMLANVSLDFRVCLGSATAAGGGVALARPVAEALRTPVGGTVQYSPVKEVRA